MIEAEARRLGFVLFGVTTPDPPPHLDVFKDWVAQGMHGQMSYLASERSQQRRSDPRQILPECRSILVLGVRYPASKPVLPEAESPVPPLTGRVASYAWGDDYHEVLPERLSSLVGFIERLVGEPIPHRWYTDTGPLLERELAQRAGLGWIGKNTCLIHPSQGSYFFLAEILLGLEIEPDQPFESDHCGNCRRCLDACPTQCILSNRTIDARRCISYLTIELKDSIPEDLRKYLGEWVFGCDICQQVCPWNVRFAHPDGDPAFSPRPDLPQPDLIRELAMPIESFNLKFRKNPVKRTRRRGYLRNVAVALGNQPNPHAVPPLREALLSDPEPLVRQHAAWALGQIEDRASASILGSALQTEQDEQVLQEIQSALERLSGNRNP